MNARLKQLIRAQGMNAAQFADKAGIQRSSISHVLSGRNKPSLDFIQKILQTFPEVSAEWLITGAGPMMKVGDLFSGGHENKPQRSTEAKETGIGREKTVAAETQQKVPVPTIEKQEIQEIEDDAERIILLLPGGKFKEYRKG